MAKRRSTTEEKGNEPADVRKNASAPGASKKSQNEPHTTTATSEPGLSLVEYHARIARKAYDLFERRGRNEGHDVEDWLEAERLVKEELLQHGETVIS
jgi:hypothetical protein